MKVGRRGVQSVRERGGGGGGLGENNTVGKKWKGGRPFLSTVPGFPLKLVEDQDLRLRSLH